MLWGTAGRGHRPQGAKGRPKLEGTTDRRPNLPWLLKIPSVSSWLLGNTQALHMPCPPVDGDVLNHLLCVCILQRNAPRRHCQNHLLELASSHPCLAVGRHQTPLQIGKGLHPPSLAGVLQTLYGMPPTWTLAVKAPAVRMGKQSLEIRRALHRTPLESVHTTAMHMGKDRPHLSQYFTLLSVL